MFNITTHLYTLDYELIFKLGDVSESSSNYFFQFPIRVHIENNAPKKKDFFQFFSEPKRLTDDVFCSNENRVHNKTVYTFDKKTGNRISNVNITYECLGLECEVGQTKTNPPFQIFPSLTTSFPFCINGKIIAQKEGYNDGEVLFTSSGVEYLSTNVDLIPLKSFDVVNPNQIVVFNKDTKRTIKGRSEGKVFISVENLEYDFSSDAFSPDTTGQFSKISFLDLDDVFYNVSIFYINSENVLQGFLEIENFKPNLYKDDIIIKIPAVQKIDEKNYEEFSNYVEKKLSEEYLGLEEVGIFFE